MPKIETFPNGRQVAIYTPSPDQSHVDVQHHLFVLTGDRLVRPVTSEVWREIQPIIDGMVSPVSALKSAVQGAEKAAEDYIPARRAALVGAAMIEPVAEISRLSSAHLVEKEQSFRNAQKLVLDFSIPPIREGEAAVIAELRAAEDRGMLQSMPTGKRVPLILEAALEADDLRLLWAVVDASHPIVDRETLQEVRTRVALAKFPWLGDLIQHREKVLDAASDIGSLVWAGIHRKVRDLEELGLPGKLAPFQAFAAGAEEPLQFHFPKSAKAAA